MRRRSHHGEGDDFVTLTNWKVSNFITNVLLKGYHIAYYGDTGRIHYWRNGSKEYHIISIDNIISSKTGIENGIYR
nr:MAG TPA: hypothetical protein [Caudoviricetes sp.]